MRIAIFGCGYVGTELGLQLRAAGHDVWGVRRDPHGLPPDIRPVAADVQDGAALAATLPPGLDAAVYAVSAGAHDDAAYLAAYVTGTARVVQVLQDHAPALRRFVFVSSTGVYEHEHGQWVDEDTPCAPRSFSGQRLLQGEQLVFASGLPATVVRLGGIYGPGRARLVEAVRAGRARLPLECVYTNRVHRADAAGVVAHVLTALDDPAALYLGVDNEPAPLDEVIAWLADRLRVPRPLPAEDDGVDAPERRGSKRCWNRRLRESGYAFFYPTYREGYGSLLATNPA